MQSTRGYLAFGPASVSDAVQSAPGEWQYTVTAQLRETLGVDVTVRHSGSGSSRLDESRNDECGAHALDTGVFE